MSIFYCAATGGYYLPGEQPADKSCKKITKAQHVELRAQNSAGKIIVADSEGFPVAVDPPGPTAEQISSNERAWRDLVLSTVVGLRDRHRDQLEIDVETTLTAEQFKELLVYMQALRDWPQSPDFPQIEHRPVLPPWIAEQTE
ncbi:phage tail assembly chaperone [Pseudomonas protegens]|uniref:phage tail assembly chaperone n=1 Tax=Pseudomonas protegens TaxID=380021 RepID=UPI0027701785|nr:phage tail assembly chaperone [Pseudomonas protegens]MDP9507874.1 phage tail assembly chaperone [Pseudomonas protegens]